MSAMPETVHGEDMLAIRSDVLEIRSNCSPDRAGRLEALVVHIRFTCLFVNYWSLAGVCLGRSCHRIKPSSVAMACLWT
jgi:hypothetical protein